MMNEARFAVGMEGLALSERAYQHARAYAKDRIQGTELGVRGGPKVSIIHHPDVRRMLMSMKSQTEAMRALAYVVGLPPTPHIVIRTSRFASATGPSWI